MVNMIEIQIARMTAYQGDLATAEEFARRVNAAQAAAVAEGRKDQVLFEAERILLDTINFFLHGEADAKFDALIARGREMPLQPADLVEVMEFKGLSALRGGREADGKAFVAEALAAARGTIAFERVQRRMASLSAEAAAPARAGQVS
jgi:hypothetical protein